MVFYCLLAVSLFHQKALLSFLSQTQLFYPIPPTFGKWCMLMFRWWPLMLQTGGWLCPGTILKKDRSYIHLIKGHSIGMLQNLFKIQSDPPSSSTSKCNLPSNHYTCSISFIQRCQTLTALPWIPPCLPSGDVRVAAQSSIYLCLYTGAFEVIIILLYAAPCMTSCFPWLSLSLLWDTWQSLVPLQL